MGVTINVNGLSLVHKGSGGMAMATVPDVCKTQIGPSVVPIPYPNIAYSSDLAKGTKTVQVDGGNPAAIFGSEFSKSIGDEAGSIGGVKSGVNRSRATWITFSFDVQIEGKGACRLTDKMLMNDGNTVCLGGEIQNPQIPKMRLPVDPRCIEIYKKIFEAIYAIRKKAGQGLQGLARRWNDAAINRGGWSKAENATHVKAYREQQNSLKKKLEEWDDQHCNDRYLPPGARFAANNQPALGTSPNWDTAISQSKALSMENIGKVLGVSTGALIAIAAITRIIRLFPPLLPLQASPI